MYERGDETGLLELFNRVFSSQLDVEDWLWKYKNNPYGFVEAVAEYGGRIVGHMGLVPVDMKVGDSIVRGAQAVDLAVHPRFRRQGMFLEIGKTLMKVAAEEAIPIVYGFPNEPAYRGHVKYGWFYVDRIPVLIKPLSVGGVSRLLLVKSYYFIRRRYTPVSGRENIRLFPFMKSFSEGIRSFPYIHKHKRVLTLPTKNACMHNLLIRQASSFDNRVDDLWNEVSKRLAFGVVRRRKYLCWRYFEKPHSDYRVLFAEKDGSLEGYVILSIKKPWDWGALSLRGVGYIVDILAKSENATECLVRAAVRYFTHEQVDLVLCWMTRGNRVYKCLLRNGFRFDKTLQETTLIARINVPFPGSAFPERIDDERHWFLTIGDSDLL